jgi:hypothetical protein
VIEANESWPGRREAMIAIRREFIVADSRDQRREIAVDRIEFGT